MSRKRKVKGVVILVLVILAVMIMAASWSVLELIARVR